MLHGEGLAQWPSRADFDPLPHRQLCPSLGEVKYNVFSSGDQLARSSAPASAIVIEALSGNGFGPSMGTIAIRPWFGCVRAVKLTQRLPGEKRPYSKL